IQLPPLRPLFHQLRRHQPFFLGHITPLPVAPPIKRLKRLARLFIRRWHAACRRPLRNHHPVIVIPWLAFPFVQFCPGRFLSRQLFHRLQRRPPKSFLHVNQHAIHVKNQNVRMALLHPSFPHATRPFQFPFSVPAPPRCLRLRLTLHSQSGSIFSSFKAGRNLSS